MKRLSKKREQGKRFCLFFRVEDEKEDLRKEDLELEKTSEKKIITKKQTLHLHNNKF